MYLSTLMWKDFRNQRAFLFAALMFLVAPFVVTAIIALVIQLGAHPQDDWYLVFIGAAFADICIAVVLIPFFAGNAIAGERADRSAEFMASLPVSRRDAILSKGLVAIGIAVGLLLVSFSIYVLMAMLQQPRMNDSNDAIPDDVLGMLIGTSIMMLGTSWFVSSFAKSATYAAAVGIGLPLCYASTLGLLSSLEPVKDWDMGTMYLGSCLIVGVSAFVMGVIYYLRRVEP